MTDKSLIAVLKKFETEGLAAVREASDLGALERVRVELLGRKEGSISLVLRGLRMCRQMSVRLWARKQIE